MSSFWNTFNEPIIALAPMEDVTDTAMRELILKIADPSALHIVMTEFASTDGLTHKKGKKRVIHRLRVTPEERFLLKKKNVKIVAQIWGNDPEKYVEVIKEIENEMEFDGIDIKYGVSSSKSCKKRMLLWINWESQSS